LCPMCVSSCSVLEVHPAIQNHFANLRLVHLDLINKHDLYKMVTKLEQKPFMVNL
jgi:hypothetical protein